MADILGTIAAATQLAEMVVKLKTLYDNIKQVPSEVLELVDEVKVLLDLMSDMHQVYTNNNISSPATSSWVKCNQLLKSSLDALTQLVRDLQSKLSAHKRTGAMRVYFKKDDMCRYRERLERAKSTMLLAQQFYSLAIFSEQQSQLLQKVQTVVTNQNSLQTNVSAISVRPTRSDQNSPQNTTNDLVSPIVHRNNSLLSRHQSSRKYYRLGLPPWLLRTGLQILYQRSSYSIGLSFRVYNTVPFNSEVFTAAQEDDWKKVDILFQHGRASPFDVTSSGLTLLHIASSRAQPDACRMLLDLGLDPTYRTMSDLTSIDYVVISIMGNLHDRFTDQLEGTMRTILHDYPVPFDFRDYGLTSEGIGFLNLSSVLYLIQETYPPYDTFEPQTRAYMAMASSGLDPRVISKMLGSDLSLQQAFSLLVDTNSLRNHMTLLSCASHNLAWLVDKFGDRFIQQRSLWKDIVREIIDFEATNANAYFFTSSYLKSIVAPSSSCTLSKNSVTKTWNQIFTSIARSWLKLLDDMNIDLMHYGKAEKLAFRHSAYQIIQFTDHKHRVFTFRVNGLTVGPHIDDWQVFVVPECGRWVKHRHLVGYEMAGGFWNWVENPELFNIPGAFVEEEEVEDIVNSGIWITGPVFQYKR